jgi:hypothetical protein
LIIAAAMIAVSWFSSAHQGAYDNVFIPAFAAVSMLFGLAVSLALDKIETRSGCGRDLLKTAVFLACIAQFSMLSYDPFSLVPSNRDREAGERLITKLSLVKGEVFIPRHGYLAWAAGKRGHAHEMAMNDVLRGDPEGAGKKLRGEIYQAIAHKRFGAVIVDYDWAKQELERYYDFAGRVFDGDKVFWPVTGMRTRPEKIYVPKK